MNAHDILYKTIYCQCKAPSPCNVNKSIIVVPAKQHSLPKMPTTVIMVVMMMITTYSDGDDGNDGNNDENDVDNNVDADDYDNGK